MSPVVAAIILIAVTVAVSIAVAAWMGALTFTWMGYEDVEITACAWTWNVNPALREIEIKITNTGTKDVTISDIKINHIGLLANPAYTIAPEPPFAFKTTDDPDKVITIIGYGYNNGSSYDIAVVTAGGHEFTDHFTGSQDES